MLKISEVQSDNIAVLLRMELGDKMLVAERKDNANNEALAEQEAERHILETYITRLSIWLKEFAILVFISIYLIHILED